MDLLQKKQVVSEVKEKFSSSSSVIVMHYHGLTVSEITKLRKEMKSNGAELKVIKNRLAKIAANDSDFKELKSLLSGPTALAFSADPIAAAKVVVNFSKDHEKLSILGGVVDSQLVDVEGVKLLASMPSLDELRGKIVGLLQAPAVKLAGVLQSGARDVVQVLKAYSTSEQ